MVHGWQLVLPSVLVYWPGAQWLHVSLPELGAKRPSLHWVQAVCPSLAWYEPGAHAVQLSLPFALAKRPSLQASHSASPSLSVNAPASHCKQLVLPLSGWYCPFGQDTHFAEPHTLPYLPAGQTVHSKPSWVSWRELPSWQLQVPEASRLSTPPALAQNAAQIACSLAVSLNLPWAHIKHEPAEVPLHSVCFLPSGQVKSHGVQPDCAELVWNV
jgi:hypothetical protein